MNNYSGQDLDLPGFRFHPTEEELLEFYLRKMVNGTKFHLEIIGTIHLYRHEPPELPGLAMIGEKEWYFFVPRDRTHANGGRPNRTTEKGFWKATGSDRPIRSASNPKRLIGLKKTLVYYKGRAPRGTRTDWVMNEYRFPDNVSIPPPKEDIVICKVYKKATTMKELEERAAMEKAKSILLNFSEDCSDVSLNNMGKRVRGGSLSSSSIMTNESMIVHPEGDAPIYSSLEWSQDKWFPYDNVLDF